MYCTVGLHKADVLTVAIRGVTVHVFVQKSFDMGLSVRYPCIPNKYSVVLTTAHAEVLCVGSVILKC